MNVHLIHFDNILVGVVEAVEGVSTDTVMKNFLGGSGLVWENCTQSRYRIDFAPVQAWAGLAKMWDPIGMRDMEVSPAAQDEFRKIVGDTKS